MSKVMSILEKCNLVERVDNEEQDILSINEEYSLESNELPENVIDITKKENFETVMKYENKMTIEEIYSLFGLENSNINTVYMLENLINAMPQNLPKDVVKQSVVNVMNASNINLSQLLSDGDNRLEALKKVMEGYTAETNNRISKYKEEIDKLSNLINNCQEQIKIRENLLSDQTYLIKCETDKVSGIIDYFSI